MKEMLEAAILVGNKSDIRFNNEKVTAIRAITLTELRSACSKRDIDFIVVEHIHKNDYSNTVNFLREFKNKSEKNDVLFLTNDEYTTGAADELDYNIYSTLKDLHNAIKLRYNTVVSTDMDELYSEFESRPLYDDIFGSDNTFDIYNKESETDDTGIVSDGAESVADVSKLIIDDTETVKVNTKDLLEVKESSLVADNDIESITDNSNDEIKLRLSLALETIKHKDEVIAKSKNEYSESFESLKETYKNAANEKINKAKDQMISLKKIIADKNSEIIELEQKMSSLQNSLVAKETELSAINDTIELSNKSDNFDLELDELKKEVRKLNSLIGDKDREKDKLSKEISTLNSKITSLKTNSNSSTEKMNSDSSIEQMLKIEIDNHKIEIDKLKIELDTVTKNKEIIEAELVSKVSEINNSKGLIENYKIEINDFKSEVNNYKIEIENLKKSHDDRVEEINNLVKLHDEKLAEIEKDKLTVKNESEVYKISLEETNNKLEAAKCKLTEIEDENKALGKECSSLNSYKSILESKVKELEKYSKDENSTIDALNSKYDKLLKEKNSIQLELNKTLENYSSMEKIKEKTETKCEELSDEIVILNKKVSEFNLELEKANDAYEIEKVKIINELAIANKKNSLIDKQLSEIKHAVDIKDQQNEALNDVSRKLKDKVKELTTKLSDLAVDKSEIVEKLESFKRENDKLKAQVDIFKTAGIGEIDVIETTSNNFDYDEISLNKIDYKSKGKIIPIFGCGSYGVTTTAVSMAYCIALSSKEPLKILTIDFDLASKTEMIFEKRSPFIDDTSLSCDGTSKIKTGLSIVVENSLHDVLIDISSIVRTVANVRKVTSIDYLSGFIKKPSVNKVLKTDIAGLMKYFGNNYDYIIVDFGRIGSSSLGDALIKNICDISYKYVAVTINKQNEFISLVRKIKDCGIDTSKLTYLMNMNSDTALTETIRRMLIESNSLDKYTILNFSSSIWGSHDLNQNKDTMLRDKFRMFVNEVVLKGELNSNRNNNTITNNTPKAIQSGTIKSLNAKSGYRM